MRKNIISHSALLIPICAFFFLKLSTLTLRLSDTNIYFYTAHQILNGELLYRDVFFTNLPLFPYLSALYLFVSNQNISFYYFSSVLEIIATSIVLYSIAYTHTKEKLISWAVSTAYLFSFIILVTSDHQTGVFSASLMATLSYFFFQKQRYIFTGIFAALAILIKAYFLPVALTFCIYFLLKKEWKSILIFSASACITTLFILLPFLLLGRDELLAQIVGYSLTRGAGTEKFTVFRFFAWHDLLLFFLLITNLFWFRKHLFFALFSLFSILFLVFYQDLYYLYFNFMVPFLLISLTKMYRTWISNHKTVSLIGILGLALINLILYVYGGYPQLQTMQDNQALTQAIAKAKPEYIYGTNDVAPLIAFQTNTPLLNNITDTNANIFRKKILDATSLTQDALSKKTIIAVHGISYSELGIEERILDEIVERELVLANCSLLASTPIKAEGIANRINLFQCF